MKKFVLNKRVVTDVLDVVDKGLSYGMGEPKPGHMCVEAAVCYALSLPHDDDPQCVHPVLRELKIELNDQDWGSNKARARGLRRLAIMQLGTKTGFRYAVFRDAVVDLFLTKYLPRLDGKLKLTRKQLKANGFYLDPYKYDPDAGFLVQGLKAAIQPKVPPVLVAGSLVGAFLSYINARDFATQRAHDKARAEFCEDLVQILASMNVPATKFLKLTEK